MTNEIQSTGLVERSQRRSQSSWLQILGTPIVEITLADVMGDLDPNWNTTGFDNHLQSGGSR